MLKLTDITKDYKVASGYVHALKGVSLEFRKNEFVCILGASGCGKTTLLNIIGGLDHYTSGDLVIQGRSTKDFKDRDWDVYRNHRIGFVFQTYNLIPHQTILSNVELALTIAGIGKEERKTRAKSALERVGLGNELSKRPNQLSGGQMQRVAIARALVNDPDILLADEPTGALDSKTSVAIMDLIKEIAGERLVIMVTHNPELAEEYASRIVRLKDGVVESDSNPYNSGEETENEASMSEETPSAEVGPSGEPAPKKREKKNRAKMGFFTSLALSFRNLLTKKGRTIITSIGGSIGIISVCLVLALSNGFGNYIRKTEEDMLSAYPLEISESTFDLSAAMQGIMSPQDMPDLKKLGDKVYINSFLTGLAQGIAIKNNVTPEYMEYLEKGKDKNPEDFAAIQYGYGFNLSDALFTPMEAVNRDKESAERFETRYFSVNDLKQYLIDKLMKEADQYSTLLQFVHYFTDVINKIPGTSDFSAPDYARYVSSQYDIVNEGGHLPKNEHEAVMVIGPNNDVIDLTLVQLGFLDEDRFLDLFRDAQADGEDVGEAAKASATAVTEDGEELTPEEENKRLAFSRILEQKYMLYYTDALYTANPDFKALTNAIGGAHPFEYRGEVTEEEFNAAYADETDAQGIGFKITAILRLKDGLSYGCLEEGLNLPEATVTKYIKNNAARAETDPNGIMAWILDEKGKLDDLLSLVPGFADYAAKGISLYISPAEHLDGYYTEIRQGTYFMFVSSDQSSVLHALGGSDDISEVSIYPSGFEAKQRIKDYLDEWNDTVDSRNEEIKEWNKLHPDDPKPLYENITYTDQMGVLMGMIETIFNLISYVLVAFTAISLIVSSVMIGIITYVSVVERVKEIGVLRSLGARKMDIRNLFNAETFMIGLASGVFGVVVAYMLSGVLSAVLFKFTGIAGMAALAPLAAFVMICVSVVLTLISGLIPAQAAAKKDPVIALRTE